MVLIERNKSSQKLDMGAGKGVRWGGIRVCVTEALFPDIGEYKAIFSRNWDKSLQNTLL